MNELEEMERLLKKVKSKEITSSELSRLKELLEKQRALHKKEGDILGLILTNVLIDCIDDLVKCVKG